MSMTAKKQLLQQAAQLVERNELALRLGTSDLQLEAWLSGDVTMPNGKLLLLAAVLHAAAKDQ